MNNAVKNWSPNQAAIFAFIDSGSGNAIVEAVAGSGKTTTIVEAMKRIPFGASAIFLAFNKAIQVELAKRGVNAKTFHSLTYSAVLNHKGAREVDTNKTRKIIDENMILRDAQLYGKFVLRLVGLGKQAGIDCLVEDTEQNWSDLASHHDVELDNESADYATAIRWASNILRLSNESRMVDFDDMLYTPVHDGLSLNKFDFVFVDEAQDTNAIQRALLRKIMHKDSRMIAVGDPAQAIYGFRGADSEALNMIAEDFNAIRLPLSVSYRCPTAVVEFAHQWVSHIEAAPNAPTGIVADLGTDWSPSQAFKSDDLVVCRTTRPLVTLAYQLLKVNVPVQILGREIGIGLESLIRKMNAKGIDALVVKLNEYTAREVEKAIAKKQESKAEAIQDKTDCILFLIENLKQTERTVPALLYAISSLFADKANAVTLATIHKAKGLEANRVYWLNSSQCPSKWARQEWQKQQERNLCYVAVTRARQELVLIEERK
jgi:DNA helicase II / ATP-dependent DNA helicase PcrA